MYILILDFSHTKLLMLMRGYIELEYDIRNNLQFPIKDHFRRRMYELNLDNILCDVKG